VVHHSEQPHQLWLQTARRRYGSELCSGRFFQKAPWHRARQNRKVLFLGVPPGDMTQKYGWSTEKFLSSLAVLG